MHSECLLIPKAHSRLRVNLRFLQLSHNGIQAPMQQDHDASSQPKIENRDECAPVSLEFEPDLEVKDLQQFQFNCSQTSAPSDVQAQGVSLSAQHDIQGSVTVMVNEIDEELLKISIDLCNETRLSSDELDRDSALPGALLSAHLILAAEAAEFVSLFDPPEEFRAHVSACRNIGNFPVLVGNKGERDMMLCSPIILYDYPQIAPESARDFYDCTEMDEMLALRIVTLTDQEKDEMRLAGERARHLLESTQQNAREQLMRTHGTIAACVWRTRARAD